MFIKKIILCLTFISIIGLAHAENTMQLGGLKITGGELQLIGTVSTTLAKDGDPMSYVGWGLIILGSLVHGGDIASAAESPDRDKVFKSMLVDARVVNKHPNLAHGKPIKEAIDKFEDKNSKSFEDKAKRFTDLVIAAKEHAKKKLADGKSTITDVEIDQFLAKNVTEANRDIFRKIFFLSGLGIDKSEDVGSNIVKSDSDKIEDRTVEKSAFPTADSKDDGDAGSGAIKK